MIARERLRSETVWKVVTPLAFLGMVVVNSLANTLPIGGMTTGALSALYPNLFVPAGFTFSIWGVIYLLLGVFSVCQFFGTQALEQTLHSIRPLFLLTSLANAGWIFAWHYRLIGLSVLVMLVLLAALSLIHRRLHRQQLPDRRTFWCVGLPFRVYLGWISVATIANITAFLVYLRWEGFGLSGAFWFALMTLLAVILGTVMLLREGDFPFAGVILWALFGILVKRIQTAAQTPLFLVPLFGIVLLLTGMVLHSVRRLRKRRIKK